MSDSLQISTGVINMNEAYAPAGYDWERHFRQYLGLLAAGGAAIPDTLEIKETHGVTCGDDVKKRVADGFAKAKATP